MRLRIETASTPGVEVGSLDVWSDGEVLTSGVGNTLLGVTCPDPDTGESLRYPDGARWVRAMEPWVNSDSRAMLVATLEDFGQPSVPALVANYVRLRRELKARGVLRADRSLIGELAEYLAEHVYGVALEPNLVNAQFDGMRDGKRVQVKARIVRSVNASTSWDFHDWPEGFDELLAFLFDRDYRELRVLIVPIDVVHERVESNKGRYSFRWNSDLRRDSRVTDAVPVSAD